MSASSLLPPPPSGAHAYLESDAIARLRELDPGGSNQLLQRVVAAFLKSLDRLLPELERARPGAARADYDLAVVRHVSHTLKSSAASLGAMELSRCCADMEAKVRSGDTHGLDELLDGMNEELRLVRTALNQLLAPPR